MLKIRKTKHITLLFAAIVFKLLFLSQTTNAAYQAELVYDQRGVFWAMAWLGDQQLLVTKRTGSLHLIDLAKGSSREISGVPEVSAKGQGGLLDLAISPPYKRGDWIYFTYAKPKANQAATTLARAKLDEETLVDWQDLVITDSVTSTTRHYGSRIALVDNYVFFTVGDRGHRPNSQDLTNHAGKILRVHRDGSTPADNPFLRIKDAKPEIWSYGHRNPQGICKDKNGHLWSSEHGPRGGDEINLIIKGANYGWPVVSHGKEYFLPKAVGEGVEKEGVNSPSKVYVPSIAPGSLLCYHGTLLEQWNNALLLGALKLKHINKVTIADNLELVGERRLFKNLEERIRALLETPKGEILFSTDSGKIYKIVKEPLNY